MAAKSLPVNDLIEMSKALIFLDCSEIQECKLNVVYYAMYFTLSFPCQDVFLLSQLCCKKIFDSALAFMPKF